MKLNPNSDWDLEEIERYLGSAQSPMRISYNAAGGYPLVSSLWFIYEEGTLWAASHKNSYLAKKLQDNPKVGFEISTNDYPYCGVRGKADALLLHDSDERVLERLIEKYLKGSNKKLASWLLSRQADEFAIRIKPVTLNAWDFASRMSKDPG